MGRTPTKQRTWLVGATLAVAAAAALAGSTELLTRPGLITSVGQSSDIAVVKVLLNTKLKLGLDVKPLATAADLEGKRTLVMVVGASTKGLGAAGLDMAKEIERTRALLKAAADRGVRILAIHTGGESRRGKTTNDLIELVVPAADRVVVVAGGNKDRIFNKVAGEKGAAVVDVESLSAAGDAVRAAFAD
jgi:hypothetical protein